MLLCAFAWPQVAPLSKPVKSIGQTSKDYEHSGIPQHELKLVTHRGSWEGSWGMGTWKGVGRRMADHVAIWSLRAQGRPNLFESIHLIRSGPPSTISLLRHLRSAD